MSDNKNVSRFYSLALGKYRNFQAKTDGLISEGVATPDVALNSLIYTNNSSTVVITNLTNGCEGQIVQLINLGSNLSFNGSNFYLSDSSDLAKNDNISFINHNNKWYETTRSHSAALDVQYTSELAADNAAPDATNAKVLVVHNSGATVWAGISGGHVGQTLTIVNTLSTITLSHNALLLNADSGGVGFLLTVSGAVTLVNINGSKWVAQRYAFTP